jgi:hypothetical protein
MRTPQAIETTGHTLIDAEQASKPKALSTTNVDLAPTDIGMHKDPTAVVRVTLADLSPLDCHRA